MSISYSVLYMEFFYICNRIPYFLFLTSYLLLLTSYFPISSMNSAISVSMAFFCLAMAEAASVLPLKIFC